MPDGDSKTLEWRGFEVTATQIDTIPTNKASYKPLFIGVRLRRIEEPRSASQSRTEPPKTNTPALCKSWGVGGESLAMTYFHTGIRTII
ncbi:hypothetical protein P3T32_004788, partial [Ralstonia sp. GP73]